MKILWLSHLIPYPPKAGVLLRSYNLLHELSKYHDIDLLSFVQRDFMVSLFPSYAIGEQESMNVLSSFCGKVRFVPISCEQRHLGKYLLAAKSLFTDNPYTINWLKSEDFYNAVIEFVKETNYNLVHFDTISLAPYRELIQGVPTVLDHHNIESHMMLRRADKEKNISLKMYYLQEGLRLGRYEKKHCKDFNLNITCSKLDSLRLLKIDQKLNVQEVPNGVDVDYFNPNKAVEEPQSLIFVGSMNWYPNVEAMHYFVENVWLLLKRKVPDCVLHIVGANPPDSIKKLADKDTNIIVHGFVDDVRPYIEKASVYVCPIRDGGGTKLKLLDAFAMKKAVVAHPVACEGIDAQPNHDVFFAETSVEFVEKICTLFSNLQLRQVTGENARKMVMSNYSYKSIGKELSEKYEKLCTHST